MTARTHSPRPAHSRERGAALLVVLWTFSVLAALAGEFAIAMRRDAESTRNFKQESTAHYTAFAGINEAILAIQAFNGELGYEDEEEDAGLTDNHTGELEDKEAGLKRIRTLIEGRGEWLEGELPGAPYEKYEIRAIDETGKIPLNANEVNEAFLRTIMLNLDYDELTASTVADSIADWRDEDDLHRAEGAEDDYYRGLDRPYPCKDAPFDAIEELMLVKGVTRAMYYGVGDIPGLRDIFTVAHDRGRITLRTVSEDVEWALCGDPEDRGMDDAGLKDRSDDQQVIDVQECLQGTGLALRRGEAQGKPQLGYATLEARVKDPADPAHILTHMAMQIQFKGDGGFQTVQWYDSVFDE